MGTVLLFQQEVYYLILFFYENRTIPIFYSYRSESAGLERAALNDW